MIQIVFRHKLAAGTEAAFVEAWERCKTKMLARAHGALEASLLRVESDPSEYVSLTRWETLEDWKTYWGEGVPDPEGERPKNEVLVELRTLSRAPSKKKTTTPARKSPARKSPAKKH